MTTDHWLPAPEDAQLSVNTIHVYRIHLDVSQYEQQNCFELLNEDEQQRAKRYHFLRHQRRFTVARAYLRLILGRYLNVPAQQVEFSYSEYGKPEIVAALNPKQLCFNLSHSHEMALLALTHDALIGIDLEYPRKERPEMEIAKRFFSEREFKTLYDLPEEQHQAGFFNAWTRKEAFIKAVGQGLSYPLDEFAVSLTPGQPAEMLWLQDDSSDKKDWHFQAIAPGDNYFAAVVINKSLERIDFFDTRVLALE